MINFKKRVSTVLRNLRLEDMLVAASVIAGVSGFTSQAATVVPIDTGSMTRVESTEVSDPTRGFGAAAVGASFGR